jgi:hypothetical protein
VTNRPAYGGSHPHTAREICVFDPDNGPLPRISEADADSLIMRGWGRWIGNRAIKLSDDAPLRWIPHDSRKTTAQEYADGRGRCSRGQLLPHLMKHSTPKTPRDR